MIFYNNIGNMFVDNYLIGEIVGKEREISVEPSERLDDTDSM